LLARRGKCPQEKELALWQNYRGIGQKMIKLLIILTIEVNE
jgi:hypothetical protein